MNIDEGQRMRGEVILTVLDRDPTDAELRAVLDGAYSPLAARRIVRQVTVGNLITNVGRADITSRIINGNTTTIAGWIAVTQTAIVPAATDTTLTGETARKACSTVSVLSTYYQRYAATFTSADLGAVTIMGLGLFTAAAVGNLWAIVSTSLAKTASESVVAEWRIQTLAS